MLNTRKKESRFQARLPAILIFLFVSLIFQFGTVRNAYSKEKESRFYLVSVGVGDADLITVRAIDIIKKSNVIVCGKKIKENIAEYLKGKEFLDSSLGPWRYYGQDCSKITDRNKRKKCEDNRIKRAKLVSEIRSAIALGKTVAVLDSGDPLIYGPKAWYLEEFEDLNPIVIPGVSCFNAANAALRKNIASGTKTHSVVLTSRRDIEKMSEHHPSMVIFTMGAKFEEIVNKLKSLYPAETPIAVVVYAGYKEKERVVRGRVSTILQQTEGDKLPFEHLIYVGDFLEKRMKKSH